MFFKKDSDIILEILKAEESEEATNMSKINQKAKISYGWVKQILSGTEERDGLIERGFVTKEDYEKHRGFTLKLTDKGREIAEKIREAKEIVGENGA